MTKEAAGKKGIRLGVIGLLVLVVLLMVSYVAASDVAYIYRKTSKIDQNFIDVFEDLGLEVDLINENNLPSDFSGYKFIFAGDERFRNENRIPVNDYPSIISNYYFGEEWGLTDYDGISKLASNSPLQVRKNGQIIQVYTQAKYSQGGISIPYYYLDDENKAPGMQKIAGTYTGNSYDFGDVISYADAGTHLINGKYAEGKICFFGIIESDFWTPAARDMLEDCIGFVSVECYDDSECGSEIIGSNYCIGDDVYRDITTPVCENPGQVISYCDSDTNPEFVEHCDYGCASGECLPECVLDSDCGTDYYSDNYCFDDDVYRDFHDFSCVGGSCNESISQELVEVCEFGCEDASCILGIHDVALIDFIDAEGGIRLDYPNGTRILEDPAVLICYQDYKVYIKYENQGHYTENVTFEGEVGGLLFNHNPIFDSIPGDDSLKYKTVNFALPEGSYNLTVETIIPVDDDPFDNFAFRDIEIVCPECFTDDDCPSDYYSDNYCSDENVVRDLHSFTCLDGECEENIITEVVEECEDICVNGECEEVECYTDSDCDDYNLYTIDKCNNPGTAQSYCTNIPVNCITDSDCGITGFIGIEYCFDNDVYKDYQTSECMNPATVDSYCNISTVPTLVNECGEYSCENWENYCLGNELRKTRNCYDNGCLNGGCFSNLITEDEFVETCEFGCENGECLPECALDSDCGSDYYGDYYCVGNNRYVEHIIPVCESGLCDEDIVGEFVEHCSFGCLEGECLNECVVDSDCGTDYYSDNYCFDDDVYRDFHDFSCLGGSCNEGISQELVEECEFGCSSGECLPECVLDSDCGTDYYSDNYCFDDDVYRDFHDFSCLGGSCNEGISQELVKECKDICVDGECEEVECYTDSDCDDYDIYTIDKCNNPGTTQSYCTNIPINCLSDYDCGITGFIGEEFCSNDNVFKTYQIADCKNEGTMDSYCEVITFPMFLIDCGGDDCDEWGNNYCLDGDLYSSRNCYDNRCEDGMCFADIFIDEKLVEECEFGCHLGECLPECVVDSDCGTDYCTNWNFICMSDDVWKRRTCYEYNCILGGCEVETFIDEEFIEECEFGCEDGECLPECVLDSDCGIDSFSDEYCLGTYVVKDFYDYECEYGSCTYRETIVLVKKCSEQCLNGECIKVECYSHSDCNDSNPLTYDKCNSAGQYDSFCSNTPITCAYDSHCGPGEECINPGGPLSYCE